MPQLPHAVTLREQAIADDQGCGLDRRDDVQPYAGHYEPHGETGKTGRQPAQECCKKEKSKNSAIHGSLPSTRRAALGWRSPSDGEAAMSPIANVGSEPV